jgi:hypothetical protein
MRSTITDGIECLSASNITQITSKINPAITDLRPTAISARLLSVLIFNAPYLKSPHRIPCE